MKGDKNIHIVKFKWANKHVVGEYKEYACFMIEKEGHSDPQ